MPETAETGLHSVPKVHEWLDGQMYPIMAKNRIAASVPLDTSVTASLMVNYELEKGLFEA
jgi:hypothetical protein